MTIYASCGRFRPSTATGSSAGSGCAVATAVRAADAPVRPTTGRSCGYGGSPAAFTAAAISFQEIISKKPFSILTRTICQIPFGYK